MAGATTEIVGSTELERLAARSRLLAADPALVLRGGGNTSSKISERDHVGRERTVLRIKASGADLATARPEDFTGLYLDELLPLRERQEMSDEEMVAYLARCVVDPGSRRPSIETLLHAFLPALHVDHVHADAVCVLTNNPRAGEVIREALGDDVAVVGYLRPGFELARKVAEFGDRRAAVLVHHGLVTWGDTHEESYGRTLELVERARRYLAAQERREPVEQAVPPLGPDDREAFLASYRGRLSAGSRRVLHVDESQQQLAARSDAAELAGAGRSTPDHVIGIGVRTLFARPQDSPVEAVDAFEADYAEFYRRNRERVPPEFAMLDPLPKVALVPGIGCVAAATDAATARVRAQIADHTHRVAAEVVDVFGEVRWLDDRELADIEYWPLELYKLTLAAPPPELAGTIAIVTGAASGIGREIALDLAARGAHLVLADIDAQGLAGTAASLDDSRVLSVDGDLADEEVVDRLVRTAVEGFGGVDAVVSNAGIAASSTLRDLSTEDWRSSLEINTTSHFLLTRRVWKVFERQGIGGSLVYVASKNAFGPGAAFGAYSVAKAGEVQLARIAAIEGGPIGVRANVVNPDAVFSGSRLWDGGLRAERAAAHGVAPEELEAFYASRNLLKIEVTSRDVAEAVAFLVSERSRATTGCVVTVDGGVAAAFPR